MSKVVIIGSNFAGISAALRLKKLSPKTDITVIDKHDGEYYPSNHKIISGLCDIEDLRVDLRGLFSRRGIYYVNDTIDKIDHENNIVLSKTNKYPYDYLIVSLGATSTFFGTVGAEKYSIPFKTSESAKIIKEKIINFESKEDSKNESNKDKNESSVELKSKNSIVVVGSGLTGVELVFELKTYLKKIAKPADIHIIDACPVIAPWANPRTQKFLKDIMAKDEIIIHENFSTVKVEKNKISSKSGEQIHFDILIWCAGLGVNPVIQNSTLEKDGKGLVVDLELKSLTKDNIYACGDCISIKDVQHVKNAHFALVQAKLVVNNINARMTGKPSKKYVNITSPAVVSLGEHGSIFVDRKLFLKHPRWLFDLVKKGIQKWWVNSNR